MASNVEVYQRAFGYVSTYGQAKNHINDVRCNDPDTIIFTLDPDDAKHLSDAAWGLLGRYITNNTHLRKLSLIDIHLNDKEMTLLFGELVSSSSLKELNMDNNDFSVDGLRNMIPFLENSPNLLTIDLSRNYNFNTECFELLIRAIHGSPVKKLSLDDCRINDVSVLGNYSLPYLTSLKIENNNKLSVLSALENYTKLRELSLRGNNIGIDGCRTLARLLQNEDSSLETLDLFDNSIDDEGMEIIANSLKNNTKLESLIIDWNNITKKGFKAFLKLLTNISSINDTYDSNHVLTEMFVTSALVSNVDGDIRRHIDDMLSINDGDNPGRGKVINYQLNSTNRSELADLQGITCPTHNSLFAQIAPVVLPDVLAIVGEECTHNDLYCALITTASDLTSLVNKPVAIKEKIEKKKERIAHLTVEYNQKVGALNTEILKLNEELQSLGLPGVSNSANTASENTTNTDNDSGKKRRLDSC